VFVSAPPSEPSHTPHREAAKPAPVPTAPPTSAVATTSQRERSGRPGRKKFRNAAESALMSSIVEELDSHNFAKAVIDLDLWTQRFHDSEYSDERAYYYMLAYNGLNQPAKVVDTGAPLMQKPVAETFEDPMQALSVLYVTVTNFQKLGRPTRDQVFTGRAAAKELLALLPTCFTAEHRPTVMTAADWAKSRSDLEIIGRETLSRAIR
jgi:hypothetical protein